MSDYQPIPRGQIKGRRIRFATLTLLCCILFAWFCIALRDNLWHSNYLSGYVLFFSIVFLTCFNLRKKLTFLPKIGSASTWMQLHIWVGLSTFLVFGFHVAWKIPNGWFEGFLASLYLIVAFSGLYGLFITRIIPKRLTAIGDEIVFERIPALRVQLAYQAKQTALGSLSSSEVIARFYLRNLLPFFERPRSWVYFVYPSGRKKRQLVGELNELQRYLSNDQREFGHRLSKFVQQKDDLDYHRAMQGRLKFWLFLHIGFTYSLLAISIMHVIMVHAFIGSGL